MNTIRNKERYFKYKDYYNPTQYKNNLFVVVWYKGYVYTSTWKNAITALI